MKKYAILISVLALPFLLLVTYVGMQRSNYQALNPVDRVPVGLNVPDDVYVIIEIPAHSDPVKYEMDKKSGVLFVDRFIDTDLRYPLNYGYIPHTLAGDGDPADVLVLTPYPVMSGAVLRVRPFAMLRMEDDAGMDNKILAVPVDKLFPKYATIKSKDDLDPELVAEIEHFFTNYKNAEAGKWVKIKGWDNAEAARAEILESLTTSALKYHAREHQNSGV